jgi:hypothetical protein
VLVIGAFSVRAYNLLFRVSGDLDLAISSEHWPRLRDVLASLGFEIVSEGLWAATSKNVGEDGIEVHSHRRRPQQAGCLQVNSEQERDLAAVTLAHLGLDESGSLPDKSPFFTMAGVLTYRPDELQNIIRRVASRSGKRLGRTRYATSEFKWNMLDASTREACAFTRSRWQRMW